MSRLILLVVMLLSPAWAFAQGIDFNAINKGRRQAEEDNYRDRQRRQEIELQSAQQLELRYEQVAENYLSNVVQNRQIQLSRGMAVDEFWRGQHQAILNDVAFQSYPPRLQEKILIRLRRWHDVLEGGY